MAVGPISSNSHKQYLYSIVYSIYSVMIENKVYKLKLQFEPGTAREFKECVTHAKGIELYVRNIHTTQSNSHTLEFESERDRTYALLLLSNDPLYTVHEID